MPPASTETIPPPDSAFPKTTAARAFPPSRRKTGTATNSCLWNWIAVPALPPAAIPAQPIQRNAACNLPVMAKTVRLREPLSGSPTLDYLNQRVAAGWKLVALEWEREAEGQLADTPPATEEIPYGVQVSSDGLRLVENPVKREIIILALDRIVEDCPLSQVADELNRRGHRTRDGQQWTPAALFNLLPRMIEVGPRLFVSEEWADRRRRLPRVV